MFKEITIKQRHEDCHYETTFWRKGMPIATGYGITQREADTKALMAYLEGKQVINAKEVSSGFFNKNWGYVLENN